MQRKMMSQKEIEVILTRQLASYLAMPVFLVDTQGTLIFYNEPAEVILGRRFQETGETPVEEWSTVFKPTDEQGVPLPPEALPLVIAITKRRPSHSSFYIHGLDNVRRHIEVTALPLIGQANRHLGAVAIFWEIEKC
jgi:PAS domain-containing protein